MFTRFQTCVLVNRDQRIEVKSTVGDTVFKVSGKAVLSKGTHSPPPGFGPHGRGETVRVTTVGREPRRGPAHGHRASGDMHPPRAAVLPGVWPPVAGDEPWPKWRSVPQPEHAVSLDFLKARLNGSQRACTRPC